MSATDSPRGARPRGATPRGATPRGATPPLLADVPLADALGPDLAPGVRRLRSRSATSVLRQRLERSGWATAAVDLVDVPDRVSIHDAFARGLAFPPWVGRNWDALDDALRDLSWWPAGPRGRLVVIRGAGRAGTPRDRQTLGDVLTTAASRWAATETPLVVLLRR